jgi:glycine betaine/proline transport system ATP-binding protein
LSSSERDHLYVLDPKHRFLGIVSSESLREALESGKPDNPISQAYLENGLAVTLNDSMQDILPQVASSSWPIPVVDDQNVYKGVVSKNRFLRTLHRTEENMETYSAS